MIQILVLRALLGKQNLKDKFSESVLYNTELVLQLDLKAFNYSIWGGDSNSSSWHNVEIEIHKISPLDTSNQILIWDKILGDHIFDTLEHFCQTNECNEIGWLLLIELNKVEKEKDKLRYSNSI